MNVYWSMTLIRFCMRRSPRIRKFWLFTLKVWVTYSSWMVCKVSFFLFLMCTCFISVPLFLSFSDEMTSYKSEMSGQQSLRVVSWLIKALMFYRTAFEYETLNCSLLVPAIALLWIETRSFCGSLHCVNPHVCSDNTRWILVKFGNVCTELYKVKEVFVYIGLLNITLHESWIKLHRFSQKWFSPKDFCMSYDVLISCLDF